jgi:hypothetical protein
MTVISFTLGSSECPATTSVWHLHTVIIPRRTITGRLCADKSGGVTTADTGCTRNLLRSGGVNDRADLHSPEASGLTQSHLRALDSFVGPRIFHPLLVDKLVPFDT